jgi:chromate reductase
MNASQPFRVLALPGSLRRAGYNRRLLASATEIAPASLRIEVGDLLHVPLFDEDLEHASNGGPPGVRQLRERVARADGLLIATPEYNHALPGVLKNTLDWLSRETPDAVLGGKPVAIAGVTSGRWGTRLAQADLRRVLTACGALVVPAPMLFISDAAQAFDEDGLREQRQRDSLSGLLRAFARWIDSCRSMRDAAVE